MTGLSIVTLAGIVVNNNIVLIDTFNKLKRISHVENSTHIINACKQRLRPIHLHPLTIFGLLPWQWELVGHYCKRYCPWNPIVDWWSI